MAESVAHIPGTKPIAKLLSILARGLALFFGAFSLINAFSHLFYNAASQNAWWIDPSFIGTIPGALLQGLAAVALVGYAILPKMSMIRRIITAGLTAFLAFAAIMNTITFYKLVEAKAFVSAPALPLSVFIAAVFLYIMFTMIFVRKIRNTIPALIAAVVIAALVMLVFPLGQMMTFGKTDYRRSADVAIVLGARVHESGRPSGILLERLDTAIDLYKDGLVPKLLMSGGVEAGGIVNEAEGMRNYAVEQGVPARDILMDEEGTNTDASVNNTVALCERSGFKRIIVVSSFYHLPRIKLAYLGAGENVYTVPAAQKYPMPKLQWFMVREIPAWWAYWWRGLF